MVEVDRLMIEEFHIELTQMMENAGRNLARLTRRRFLAGNPNGRQLVVLAGTGGNGGGGMVMARHIHNWGANVTVILTRPVDSYKGVPGHQLDILVRMGVPIKSAAETAELGDVDLIVDALIGYSLRGAPRGAVKILTDWANDYAAPILSLDAPSGIDSTVGEATESTIRATATMTLALPKVGLRAESAKMYVGELYMADIGVPPELYSRLGIEIEPIFSSNEIIRLV